MAKAKGRPRKPNGEGVAVRLDPEIVAKAKYLAARKKLSMADYLCGILRPVVDRDFDKAGRELLSETEKAKE